MNQYELFLSELDGSNFEYLDLVESIKSVMNDSWDICIDEKIFTDLNSDTYELFIKAYAHLLSLDYDCEDIEPFFLALFENDLTEYQIGEMCYHMDVEIYKDSEPYQMIMNAKYKTAELEKAA